MTFSMTMTNTERLRSLVDTLEASELPELSEELVCSLNLPVGLEQELPIAEVAALTGVSAHTLRYYERIGLVDVARDAAGRRVYDSQALARVVFVTRLRMSDMSIRDISHYIGLVRQGSSTVPERLAFLQAHREAIRQRLRDLNGALAVIDYKITTYGGYCEP